MIYHHYASQAAIHALWQNRLKISSPCDFNDPLEFLPASDYGNPETLEKYREWCLAFQKSSRHGFYVLSMSTRDDNSRMWAQYGEDHTGMMISIDFTIGKLKVVKDFVKKVNYKESSRLRIADQHKPTSEEIMHVLTHKGEDWEHEEEVRLILTDSFLSESEWCGKDPFEMYCDRIATFMPLPDLNISGVTLGLRSSDSLIDNVLKIKKLHGAKWEVFQAKLHDSEYRIYNQSIG